MKILQINSSKTYGGGERHFVDLCRGLVESGQEVHVAIRPACEWKKRLDFIPKENINQLSMLNSTDVFSARRLSQIVRSQNIDIIHAHVARDYPLAAVASMSAPGARLIITRHLMFRLKNINRILLRRVDAAIGVSEAVAQKLRDILPKEKVVCVHNGLDATSFDADEITKISKEFRFKYDIPYDVPVVTHIGALKKLKGHLDFVRAAGLVGKQNPDVRFVLIGKSNSSNEKFLDELKRATDQSGVADRLIFIDWLDDISPALISSNIFSSFSHSESFGLTVLEAMANRMAIVASRTDGHTELIRDREEGLLFDIGDHEQGAELINELLTDEELIRNLAAAAQATATERFNTKRMIDDTLRVYRYVWNS